MRMVPGSAIDCRRAATLIVSPIAVWSPSGSSPRLPTTTEPLLSPIRTSTGSRPGGVRSRSSRRRRASAARTARRAWSSCAVGTPMSAMNPSPMKRSIVPP